MSPPADERPISTSGDRKIHIGPVNTDEVPESGGADIAAHYNPKELQVDKSMPWSKHSYTNKNGDTAKNGRGNLHLEFTGAEGRSMTIELMFDGYEKNQSCRRNRSHQLETLTNVMHPDSR